MKRFFLLILSLIFITMAIQTKAQLIAAADKGYITEADYLDLVDSVTLKLPGTGQPTPFGGVADLATVPVIVGASRYTATQPGTYTNFGNLAVLAGEVVEFVNTPDADTGLPVWSKKALNGTIKEYAGIMNQAGTNAPTENVYCDTFTGRTITRLGPGEYKMTATGQFLIGKTFIQCNKIVAIQGSGPPLQLAFINWGNDDDDAILINTFDVATGMQMDGILENVEFHVIVYN